VLHRIPDLFAHPDLLWERLPLVVDPGYLFLEFFSFIYQVEKDAGQRHPKNQADQDDQAEIRMKRRSYDKFNGYRIPVLVQEDNDQKQGH
jgi:hypothetical protein